MPKALDLRGQRFGRLTVLDETPKSKDGNRYWHCKCDCGNDKWIRANLLKAGKVQSCGCYSREKASENYVDLRGQRFGRLTVLDHEPKSTGKYGKKWLCRCDCGNELWVRSDSLRRGGTQSCGCLQREVAEANRIDLRGKRFGRLTVLDEEPEQIRKENGTYIKWHCRCDCGGETWATTDALLSGHTESCGCLNAEKNDEMRQLNYIDGTSVNNLLQKTASTNRTGYKNIYWDSRLQRYRAVIKFQGKNYSLGTADNPDVLAKRVERFREDIIYPFIEDKMVGIKTEDGKYRAFLRGKEIGVFNSVEDANKARIKEAIKSYKPVKD